MSYFRTTTAYATATSKEAPTAIALVTGGKSGIGLALAQKIASFDFIDKVLAVSRSITAQDVAMDDKIQALQADVSTLEGRTTIVQAVEQLCQSGPTTDGAPPPSKSHLRFLVHSAGVIDPIKPVWDLTADELRKSMVVNCEAPLLLTTALYPYMKTPPSSASASEDDGGNKLVPPSSRVLHVSSGAAHGAPPVGWGAYGISKAAFFQSFKVLEREFRHDGGRVVVGSFKPGVVDTSIQQTIRDAPTENMPIVENFRNMKAKMENNKIASIARPPPKGQLDTPENVAFFAEYLLLGTTDEEFANANDPNEHDIRNTDLFCRWILPENIPSS